MARRARSRGVGANQRESSGAVVKHSGGPSGNGVAGSARGGGGRETRSDVIRYVATNRRRGVPRRDVAGHAVRGVQRVIVIDMAGSAWRRCRRHVRSGQSKSGQAVIERRGGPTNSRVASRAIIQSKCGTCSRVHRIGGLLPGSHMAAGRAAGRWCNLQTVVVIDVAQRAGDVRVAVGEQEPSHGVIERRRVPTNSRVAGRAIVQCKCRARSRVHRIVGLLPGGHMAAGCTAG